MLKNCQVSLFITAVAEAFGLPSLLFQWNSLMCRLADGDVKNTASWNNLAVGELEL